MQSVELAGRVLVSLAAVLAVIWLLARKLRGGGRKGSSAGLIDVIARQRLSNNASVAVIRVGQQALVVGVTDGHVNVLGETDLAAFTASAAPEATAVPAPAAAPAKRSTVRERRAVDPTSTRSGAAPRGRLAGSAISPQTWRQTIEALRDLTAH